jgi:hypothetical protein
MALVETVRTLLWYSQYHTKAEYLSTVMSTYLASLNQGMTPSGKIKTYDIEQNQFLDASFDKPTFRSTDRDLQEVAGMLLNTLTEYNDLSEKDQVDIKELIPMLTIGIEPKNRNTFIINMIKIVDMMKSPQEGKVYSIDQNIWVDKNLDCDIVCSADSHKVSEYSRGYAAMNKLYNIIIAKHLSRYNQRLKDQYTVLKNQYPEIVEVIEMTFPQDSHYGKVVEYVPLLSKIVGRKGNVPPFDLDKGEVVAGPEKLAPNLVSEHGHKTLIYNQLYHNYYKWDNFRKRRDYTYEELRHFLSLPESFDTFTQLVSNNDPILDQYYRFNSKIGESMSDAHIDMEFWIRRLVWHVDDADTIIPFAIKTFKVLENRPSKFHQYNMITGKWVQGGRWSDPILIGGSGEENDFYNHLYREYKLILKGIDKISCKSSSATMVPVTIDPSLDIVP